MKHFVKNFTVTTFVFGFFVVGLHVLKNISNGNSDPVLSACLTICCGINYLMFKDYWNEG